MYNMKVFTVATMEDQWEVSAKFHGVFASKELAEKFVREKFNNVRFISHNDCGMEDDNIVGLTHLYGDPKGENAWSSNCHYIVIAETEVVNE